VDISFKSVNVKRASRDADFFTFSSRTNKGTLDKEPYQPINYQPDFLSNLCLHTIAAKDATKSNGRIAHEGNSGITPYKRLVG